jgi:uncharacterized caspase-like protein
MRPVPRLITLIIGLVLLTGVDHGFAAPPRIALVIGNSAYKDIPLANPANDARLIDATLRGLGFDVVLVVDADQKTMKYAIVEFGERLAQAGGDAVGLFFYAGHGLQVDGQNYLVPLAAEIEKESHVAIEAVSAGWVLGEMEFAGNAMNFVILDACRNNPLSRSFRSGTRGLARMDAPRGSIVAYSTGPGEVARDGDGFNSPYTTALAREMKTSGVSVERMFKQVRIAVMADTDEQQVPWESSSLTGDFYFAAPKDTVEAEAPVQETSTLSAETALWAAIENSTNPVDYMAYLAEYPDSAFAALARARVESIQVATATQETREASTTELTFWDAIKNSGNAADYEAYVAQYPDGTFATLAINRIAMLQAGTAPVTEAQQQASLPDPTEEVAEFDGDWILKVRGDECSLVGRTKATVVVSNSSLSGSIKFGSFGMFQLQGTILPSGKLERVALLGRFHIKLRGKVAGDEGRGKWLGPQGECNGTFVMTRAASG